MGSGVLVALIGGLASISASVITVISVVVTSNKNNAAMDAKLDKQIGIIETEIKELTREVREHNNFVTRLPAVEKDIQHLTKRLDALERRIG